MFFYIFRPKKRGFYTKKTAKTVGRKILRGGQETQNVVAPLPVLAVKLAKKLRPLAS